MRRHYLLITVILTLAISQAFGATTLPEMNITAPTTWYKAGNPYTATGIITVDSGATLTIEAGVDIQFNGQPEGATTGIQVNRGGFLFANGTMGDSIYLKGNGIQRNGFIADHGYIHLSYCRLENMNGNNYFNRGGAIICDATDSSEISHCMFNNNSTQGNLGGAIAVEGFRSQVVVPAKLDIKDSYFCKNHVAHTGQGGAIFLNSGSSVNIIGCVFDSNYVTRWGYAGAIHIYSGIGGTIKNNIFFNNYAYEGGAIESNYDMDSTFVIEGNLFYHNNAIRGGAINIGTIFLGMHSNSLNIKNNTIVENSADTCGGIFTWQMQNPQMKNNIIWNNIAPIDAQTSIDILNLSTFSCIEGYSNAGNNVINQDPLFASPLIHNYHLTANSPCINTGDPASPQDPDYTRADMGAYYFQLSNGSGDVNNNCGINGLDVVYLVGFFKGRITAPPILWKADADGNCNIDGLDVSYLVNYFKGKNRGPFRNTSCTWNPPPPPDQCGW